MRRDCRWSVGPEVRGRRTLQELSVICPVWDFITGCSTDEELAFELGWNSAFWQRLLWLERATVLLPTDTRW